MSQSSTYQFKTNLVNLWTIVTFWHTTPLLLKAKLIQELSHRSRIHDA